MNVTNILVKCMTLLVVYAHVTFGKSYADEHMKLQKEEHQNEVLKNAEIDVAAVVAAKLNDSETLAAVIGKEPKFFDEFECKYLIWFFRIQFDLDLGQWLANDLLV